MARPRKPATTKQGKSETKEHLDARSEVEENMRGDDSLLRQAPAWLDEYGVIYYHFMLDQMEQFDFLGNLDIPVVAQTADCLSKMQQLDEYLKKPDTDLIIHIYDKQGNDVPKENPAIGTKLKYLVQFRALATQLGLSPSSRAQLAEMQIQEGVQEKDVVDAIINGD